MLVCCIADEQPRSCAAKSALLRVAYSESSRLGLGGGAPKTETAEGRGAAGGGSCLWSPNVWISACAGSRGLSPWFWPILLSSAQMNGNMFD
jgi:hypothetical protein